MKMKKTRTGKTATIDVAKKEKHQIRKYKLVYLYEIEAKEKQQEIKEYNAKKQIQE
jgi:hypothetical protein